jgi:hypothetical protein
LSFLLTASALCQDTLSIKNQKSLTLILTKKTNAKKVSIKTGDRLKIVKQDAQEIEGKVKNIDQNTIYFKNGSVALDNIYSIEKKNSIARQLVGGLVAGVGSYFVVGGVLFGVFANTKNVIIAGSIINAVSIPILIHKTYSSKRWVFTIE